MAKHSLTERAKSGFYRNLAMGALAFGSLYGCGNGVEPVVRSFSQSAQLVNDEDIRYTASFKNVDSGTRRTLHNGGPMDVKTISGPNYSETLEKSLKGDYMFVLEVPDLKPDTSEASVPEYLPEEVPGAFSSLVMDFKQGSQATIDLEGKFFDRNTIEDNPVPIQSSRVLSGDVSVFLDGYSLSIVSNGNPGAYEVEVIPGSEEGGLGKKVFSGNITEVKDRIAFWSNRDEPGEGYNEDIYSKNLDGTELQRLTTDPGQDLEPTYSPDGKEILFTSHRTGGTAIWRMNEDGSNQRDITSNLVERARQADWCSNGLIAVSYRDKGDSEAGIGIVNPDENSFTPVYSETRTGRVPGWPTWSPDCSEIAFERYLNDWEVSKISADGNDLRDLTNHPCIDGLPD